MSAELINTLGPTAGAIAMVTLAVWRGLLPYLRDTYLPARLKVQQDMAAALTNIGDIARESNVRLAHVETRLATVSQTQAEAAEDIAGVYALLQAPRPSRNRAQEKAR